MIKFNKGRLIRIINKTAMTLFQINYIIYPTQTNAEIIVINTKYIKQAISEAKNLVFNES